MFLTLHAGRFGLDVSTSLAADRHAHGDDVLAAFRRRSSSAARRRRRCSTRPARPAATRLLASRAASLRRRHSRARRDSRPAAQRRAAHRSSVAHVPADADDERPRRPTTRSEPGARRASSGAATGSSSAAATLYAGERGIESHAVRRASSGRWRSAIGAGSRELEQRALTEGTDAPAATRCPKSWPAQFIDRVRNAMVVQRAGAQTVPMTSRHAAHRATRAAGRVQARLARSARGARGRSRTPTIDEGDLDAGARHVHGAHAARPDQDVRRAVSEDSDEHRRRSSNANSRRRSRSNSIARRCSDRAPRRNRAASKPERRQHRRPRRRRPTDYDFLVDAIGRLWAENHEPNARDLQRGARDDIAKFKRRADDQPLRVPESWRPCRRSARTRSRTRRRSPDETTLFVGDFTQLMIGLRTSFRLEVSRVAGDAFEKLQIARAGVSAGGRAAGAPGGVRRHERHRRLARMPRRPARLARTYGTRRQHDAAHVRFEATAVSSELA